LLDEHSVTWRYAGDARILPFLGRAFLLQAAHPTIAAGVADHSIFKDDPFGRFRHSYGLVLRTLYSADGPRVGGKVRENHRQIKGVKADGTRYTAFEPEASFWVIATGHETIVETRRRLGRPLSLSEQHRAYDEMREIGRRFWLRDRDMPETLERFQDWYAWMLAERIENNQTVQDVLTTFRRPNPPQGVPDWAWPLPRAVAGRLGWLTTVGTLTPAVRKRLEIPWGRIDEAQLSLILRGFQALELVPADWCYLPPAREAFERSQSCAPAAPPGEERAA
jgi:uncharacterized protein (DUF2236 family)